MGLQLPRGQPCCLRLQKATLSQPASQPLNQFSQGRTNSIKLRPRRVTIKAFLFNPLSTGSGNSSNRNNRSRESIANRLSELRTRKDDGANALSSQRPESEANDVHRTDESSSTDGQDKGQSSARLRQEMVPLSVEMRDGDDGSNVGRNGPMSASLPAGTVTPRSLRYMISDPKPEIKLLHRFKPGHGAEDNADFWRSFMDKCRLAWGVFFPPAPQIVRRTQLSKPISQWAAGIGRMLKSGSAISLQGDSGAEGVVVNGMTMTPKQVVLSRLQMVLIADRCGVSPEHLLEMKAQTLTALAEYMGKDLEKDVAQLEVQVSALKPNGERITMTIGFADMVGEEQLRDPIQYHYEFEDDDDYFMPEDDDGRIADIAEAPEAGLKAARIAAKPVASRGGPSASDQIEST